MKARTWITLIVSSLLLAVALIPGPQQAKAEQDLKAPQSAGPAQSSDAISSHPNTHTIEQMVGFWTEDRLADAQPVPDWVFERTEQSGEQGDIQLQADGAAMVSSPVLPGGSGVAAVGFQAPGGSTTTPTFAYPFAYTVTTVDTAFHGFYPWRVNGKLFFTNSSYGVGTFSCSATVVTSGNGGNQNLLLTAGHCLNVGGSGGTVGEWSDNVVFSPGRRNGINPQGLWTYSNQWALTNWTGYSNTRQDYGFVVVNGNGFGCGDIQFCYGAQGVAWNQSQLREFWATGYPVAAPYAGERMILCTASTALRDPFVSGAGPFPQGEAPMGIGCDMTNGASGGSWVIRASLSNGGFANSVNSYKYVGPAQPLAMYGPYFDSQFGALWDAARVDVTSP